MSIKTCLGSASTWRPIQNDIAVESAKDNFFVFVVGGLAVVVAGNEHQNRQKLIKASSSNIIFVSPLMDDANVVQYGENEH
mmetsp:Transcript_22891/g.56438  ORF Transcript_22891/g.56438 Transcript_22891/m.56438 type:complete len:81 (-) Transcript_22891:541-783(-)